jgi:hypothetical protein
MPPRGKRGRIARFCSRECRRGALPERACAVCSKTFRPVNHTTTRCSNSCAHTGKRLAAKPCSVCGWEFQPTTVKQRSCSTLCARVQQQRSRQEKAGSLATCSSCGTTYAAKSLTAGAHYCSKTCRDREANHRRRCLTPAHYVGPVNLRIVRAQDNHRCYLCGLAVCDDVHHLHSLAPSLDHVVPLSQGGLHCYENVRLAHVGCNARKGNESRAVGATTVAPLVGGCGISGATPLANRRGGPTRTLPKFGGGGASTLGREP